MIWIGLTGGIASGKSTAAEHLARKGFSVVDADQLAHQVVALGSLGLKKVLQEFGTEFQEPDGSLDRKKMGQLIFKDASARDRLEKIIHPLVQDEVRRLKLKFEQAGTAIAFYDIPLLFEKRLEKNFDAILLITCSEDLQKQRLQLRNQMSDKDISDRLSSQISLVEKEKKSDFVVRNDKDLEDLYRNLDSVVLQMTQKAYSRPI